MERKDDDRGTENMNEGDLVWVDLDSVCTLRSVDANGVLRFGMPSRGGQVLRKLVRVSLEFEKIDKQEGEETSAYALESSSLAERLLSAASDKADGSRYIDPV